MSTLNTTNIKHASSSGNNIVLDSSGNVSVDNDLKFDSGYGSTVTGYGVRAWCTFNGTGTVAIDAHGNFSSLTDHGTGEYTLTMSTAMPDTHYAVIGGLIGADNSQYTYSFVAPNYDPLTANTTSAFRFTTSHYSNGDGDYDHVNIMVVR